jgi:hypothetical protein
MCPIYFLHTNQELKGNGRVGCSWRAGLKAVRPKGRISFGEAAGLWIILLIACKIVYRPLMGLESPSDFLLTANMFMTVRIAGQSE